MNIENQVANIELSIRLKELGVKQESLFYWTIDKEKDNKIGITYTRGKKLDVYNQFSAFTVGELGIMLPKFADGIYLHIYYEKTCTNSWLMNYSNKSKNHEIVFDDFNEANVRARCIIYLIENKLILFNN